MPLLDVFDDNGDFCFIVCECRGCAFLHKIIEMVWKLSSYLQYFLKFFGQKNLLWT